MVFFICCLVTMSINWVQILIKDSAFCLIQTFKNVYLCPTQRTDCSLMHVLIGLGHKNLHLLPGMRSSNKHQIMLKWGIFNASVFLNQYLMSMGTLFYLKFSYDKYSVDKVPTKIYCHFYFRGITLTRASRS